MDAIELLLNRVSSSSLQEPGPTDTQLDVIYRAALRAPDHGALRPWRFLNVRGEARSRLGEVFQQAATRGGVAVDEGKLKKLGKMALRAPLVVVVIARTSDHPKVPVLEQQLASGAAAQNLLLAAYAQGIGGIWRTGEMAYNPHVEAALGLAENENIIGFLYLGTPPEKQKKPPQLNPCDFVSEWQGPQD